MITNALYILAFTILFSVFDYFGYNEFEKRNMVDGLLAPYRIVQTSFQIILIGLALYFFGWKVAVGFTLLWWTWCCDFTYYWIHGKLKIYPPKNAYEDEVKGGKVRWAWWTPFGLYDLFLHGKELVSGIRQYRVIEEPVLLWQAWVGILMTILICII